MIGWNGEVRGHKHLNRATGREGRHVIGSNKGVARTGKARSGECAWVGGRDRLREDDDVFNV